MGFLQEVFAKGLQPNTVTSQVSALSSVMFSGSTGSLAKNPQVARFLREVQLASLAIRTLFQVGLATWTESPHKPFKPLMSVSALNLFWMAIMSTRQALELAVLSMQEFCCMFQEDKVLLRIRESLVPKVNSSFHGSTFILSKATASHHGEVAHLRCQKGSENLP